ncbi:unnamed protein product [Adineta steineri]|uniref:Neurobeachin-like protein 1 n=1 Tax=Adineta steineri TaxID=433720 RepID=A0A818R6P2_9BILA|nr:unnamed protein product [Adineta steineri]
MLINEKNLDQIIDTIRKLHQTTIDQRLVDLTDYLTEFLQSIQVEQSNIFRTLTQLIRNSEDRTALKIEFLKAQCLEIIYAKVNNNENENNIIAILEFIIELLNNSENVQEKFLHFNGYEKYFKLLSYIHSPTIEFINQLIILMIEKSTLPNEDIIIFPIDSFVIFNNPHIAISLLYWIPYLNDISHQCHIISSIEKIILRSLQNKMMACSNRIIFTLLDVLKINNNENSNKLDEKILFNIFSLLENLSRFSINAQEIRLIWQLFHQNTSLKTQLLQLLITAAKYDDPDTQSISSYFDLQRPNSGIILPVIHRWSSLSSSPSLSATTSSSSPSSPHFSFHCWLKLNHEIGSYPYGGRRQIYSFYSQSIGLESFIRSSSITVLITDHREIAYIEINDCDDLFDGYWHSLTIVHTAQRPSLFGSAFQTTLCCNLTIYIDGSLRKEIKNFKYVSNINDPITSASIGSSSQRPKSSEIKQKNESLSTTLVKTIQPFKGLFTSRAKPANIRKENQGFYSQNVMIIEPESQEAIFGQSICLYGQIACIWILTETLDEQQVKQLYEMGGDFCHQYHSSMLNNDTSISSVIFDLISTRSLLLYHPLACNGQICIDISSCSTQINGRLINGSCLRLYPFSESLVNLGGCPILYPLIELFQENDTNNILSYDQTKTSDNRHNHFYSNPIASIIYLIRCILSSKSMIILTEQIAQHYNIEILGEYLNHISSSSFIDQQLLMSIEELIESSRSISSLQLLTIQLIQHILFNFTLWNKSNFHVRLLHLQYILKVIKEEKNFDRDKFGIQFFLDILKQHFNTTKGDKEEQRELREIIYEIMKYFLQNHTSMKDLNALLSTISVLSVLNDEITYELLEFIVGLLNPTSAFHEQIIDFLGESNMIEGLYSLLVVNNLSSRTKEIILKIMKCFIGSKRTSQQIRAQLRLETNHIGFGGIISGIALHELNESIVQEILNLIISSNSASALHHLNIVLTLCSAASINVRHIAMRKLMTYFLNHPAACRLYAKCHGWQETLANFFVKMRRSSLGPLMNQHHNSSPNLLYSSTRNLSLNLGQECSKSLDMNNENQRRTSAPHLDIASLHDLSPEKPISLSVEDIATNGDLMQFDTPSEQCLTSDSTDKSMDVLTNTKDTTTDLHSLSNEIIITPPSSNFGSREDLISLLKTENSNENLNEMMKNDNNNLTTTTTLQRTSTSTSMPQLYDDKENIREYNQFSCEYRNFLGWLIALVCNDIKALGIKSTDDSSLYMQSSINISIVDILEEMCETLILAIVMILWKGIIDSDDTAWTSRGQIFSALRHLHREHDLYLPLDYIERRILELSMEACLDDIKLDKEHSHDRLYRRRISLTGIRRQTPIYENNCRELIKLVNDFLSQSIENNERITENFVNGIIPILDIMLMLKINDNTNQSMSAYISHHDHYSETSLTGLNILLILLAHPNQTFCSQACKRIYALLKSRSLNGREEAAYLLSKVNHIFLSKLNTEDSEQQTYLLSLMKSIMEKSFDLLEMQKEIANIPFCREILSTFDDFCQCILSMNRNDWQMFIQKVTEPYADHYCSMSVRPFQMNMKIWWNNCQAMINISIVKRNQQIEAEKLKFQTYIVEPWHQRSRLDEQRALKIAEQRRIQQIHIDDAWKNRKKYLYGERGLWLNTKNIDERRWMLSERENIHRMKCKLIENDRFNKHEESSRLRDNLRIDISTDVDRDNTKEISKNEQKDDLYGSDEHELLNISNETQSFLSENKEKILLGTKCSLITVTSITDGEFIITDKNIYFFDSTRLKTCQNDFKYPLLWLQDVYLRRYNLRPTALEFFLINQTNFLLNFDKNFPNSDKKIRRQIIQKLISLKLPSMKNIFQAITPQEILKESKITEKWLTREMSNFDYLMMLNTIAGRTYNDLNQYPIFPWVLKDYTSQVLDVNNPESFRDFSKPIGIQNPKHIDEVKAKYESFEDPTGLIKKFHYGTHYSNAASVMHYLIRMEPFTTLHIQLQSGKFDIADRQFHSFQSSWTNIMDSHNDGKELIPEFFYLPEFLSNLNKFDLGKLQSNNQLLNDVQLPPWAHNSPEEFIRLHRLALESNYVSEHLHEWIDLIFGYKQTGEAAIDALNVFMYCSYETAVDGNTIDDDVTREAIDSMIQNFGQIPSQLLTEPHPPRQTREQATFQLESQGRPSHIFQNLNNIKAFFVEILPHEEKLFNPIIYISIPKNQLRSFIHQGIPDVLITINTHGVIGNNGWHPYDRSSNNFFTFERDPTLLSERNRLNTTAPFSPSIDINTRLFAVSHDAKFIYSGAHWDWSLRTYSITKAKTINSIVHHTDIITCLTLDSTGYILITGSRDTTCIIWYLTLNEQDSTTFTSPKITLYGHTAEVTCVAVSSELDLVASGSLDGTCNMYTMEHGIYVRTLRPTNSINDPIVNLKVSDERHILIQTEHDDTHLFLYSINGHLIRTRKFEYHVVDMLLSDQYIILAVNHSSPIEKRSESTSSSSSSTQTSAVIARVIIKDMFEMITIQTIRLRTEINCLYLTKDYSHLLVSVKDGKLFVLTAGKKRAPRRLSKFEK